MKDDRDPTKVGQRILERPEHLTACQAADWVLEGIKPLPLQNGKPTRRGMAGHVTRRNRDS